MFAGHIHLNITSMSSLPFSAHPYAVEPAATQPELLPDTGQDELLALAYLDRPIGSLLFVGEAGRACFTEGQETPPGEQMDSIFQAHCRLYQWQQQGQLPEAILCAPQLRDGTALHWRAMLQQDPDMRQIPFLVVGDPVAWPSRAEAQACGIDDCMSQAADPRELRHRITFLQQHKAALLALTSTPPVETPQRRATLKRVIDFIISALGLMGLAPVLLFHFFRLRLASSGPVFVKLPRVGQGYQLIHCLAFRGGDRLPFRWWHHVPRLWNVLRGDLSLVGNRPLPLTEAEQLTTDQWAGRFLAPAGLTGPWRVAQQRQQPCTDRQRRDLEVAYAQQLGLRQDLHWLIRTFVGLFTRPTPPIHED
jgi:lipopolysaccharide/colanic/teichoic acid biosynthesis glycosyltransferase